MSSDSDGSEEIIKRYSLPVELVHLVILNTDHRTFITCRMVCSVWKQIVDYISQNTNQYKKFCEDEFKNIWEQIFYRSKMHYREIYFNLKMWPKINTAVESKGLLFDFQFNSTSDSIIALNSSTDGKLYIITTLNQPIILDTETRQKVNTSVNLSEYPGRCKYFTINKYAIVLHYTNMMLYIKQIPDIQDENAESKIIVLPNVGTFRILDDTCIYITTRGELCKCDLIKFNRQILAKWYNPDKIKSVEYHKNNILMLTQSGSILSYKDNGIYKIDQANLYTEDVYGNMVDLSVGTYKMYLNTNIVIMYFDYHHIYIKTENGTQIYRSMFSINSGVYYANMLLFGTYCGEIYIYTVPKESDLLRLDLSSPIIYHALSNDHAMKPILGFEVHEKYGCHYIFFWTESCIFYLKYDHLTNEKNVQNLVDDAPGGNLSKCSIFKNLHCD